MKRVTEPDLFPWRITKNAFKAKMKKWRESTSTSPSGRYLGHYKALFVPVDRSLDEEERKDIRKKQEEIADCYVAVINHALTRRYSLERWKTIVNMMIYKEPGNAKIHRLRVIHLYEADYGFLIGKPYFVTRRL